MLTTEQRERFLCRGKCTDTYKTREWITGYYHFVKMDSGALSGVLHVIMIPAGVEYAFTRTLEINLSTLGRCTGLRDKKGTLIFEGDIVTGIFNRERVKGEISYSSEATFFIKREGLLGIGLNNASDWLEVIGNVHDGVIENADAS